MARTAPRPRGISLSSLAAFRIAVRPWFPSIQVECTGPSADRNWRSAASLLGPSVALRGLPRMTPDLTPTAVALRGWEPVGSTGDHDIRYLVALGRSEPTRVWVVARA